MKTTASDVVEICRLRLEGATLSKIAEKFGIHPMYVQSIIKGWTRKNVIHPVRQRCIELELARLNVTRSRRRIRAAAYPKAIKLYLGGMNLRQSASKCGMHWMALQKELVRRNIARRRKGRPSIEGFYSKG